MIPERMLLSNPTPRPAVIRTEATGANGHTQQPETTR